jgi:hypothetical protein
VASAADLLVAGGDDALLEILNLLRAQVFDQSSQRALPAAATTTSSSATRPAVSSSRAVLNS